MQYLRLKFFHIIIISVFYLIFTPNYLLAEEVQTLYVATNINANTDEIEKMVKEGLPLKNEVLYTKVPRGIIVSIDERVFFNDNHSKIKASGAKILDAMSDILEKMDNNCVVEGHTTVNDYEKSHYHTNWELSIARAGNIVKYLVEYDKIPKERVFALGFGDFMPFHTNVSSCCSMDNRIDFVILEYEAKR